MDGVHSSVAQSELRPLTTVAAESRSVAGKQAEPLPSLVQNATLMETAPASQVSHCSTSNRSLDTQFARSQFPSLSSPDSKIGEWIYCDSAGGSHMCRAVIERKKAFIDHHHFQPFGYSDPSQAAGELFSLSHERIAKLLNVAASEIHFGPSTTQNVYVLAHALRPLIQPGEEIIISNQNHEANIGAWERHLDPGVIVKTWSVDPHTGLHNIEDLKALMSDKTRFITIPHTSNIVGEVNDVHEIVRLAKISRNGVEQSEGGATDAQEAIQEANQEASKEIIVAVDGVAQAAHEFPDLQALGADIYLFSMYKTFGPAAGVMYVKTALLDQMSNQSHYFNNHLPQKKLVPAGPNYENIAAAAGIADYIDLMAEHHNLSVAEMLQLMQQHERQLIEPQVSFLSQRDDVRLLGPAEVTADKVATIAFFPTKKPIAEVMKVLNEHKVMAGAGSFYAVRLLGELGIPANPGVIRFSFLHYNTEEEIAKVIKATELALD